MVTSIDHIIPEHAWRFDSDVTAVFDDMLTRSIPQYEVMRRAVFEIGLTYAKPATAIVDLGASRGQAIAPFVHTLGEQNTFICIEISEAMHQVLTTRFANQNHVIIRQDDLRYVYPPERASLTLSILTLQFIPIEYRQRIVRSIYNSLVPGGAFVLVEKVLGASAEIDTLMVDRYYALKGENGYSPEQIERKRLSLEGVLVPVTAKWNEELLNMAGFRYVDCFWRWMNFAGWIAIKE